MEPGNAVAPDAAKRPSDWRIAAFCPKSLSAGRTGHLLRAEHGGEGQETLIGIVIEKLFFHTGVCGKVGQSVIGIEEQTVFRKSSVIHGVGEGAVAAPVIIEGLVEKAGRGSFQQAGIDGKPVFAQFKGQGNTEKMFFEKRSAKQFVAEAGGDSEVVEIPGKKHDREDALFKSLAVIETGGTDVPPLNAFIGRNCSVVTANDICVMFCGSAAHMFIHGGINPVVAVHESHIFTGGISETFLPCRHVSAVFFVDTADAGVLRGVGSSKGGRAICGAIIYEKNLEIRKGLGKDAVETFGKAGFCIIYGHDDA